VAALVAAVALLSGGSGQGAPDLARRAVGLLHERWGLPTDVAGHTIGTLATIVFAHHAQAELDGGAGRSSADDPQFLFARDAVLAGIATLLARPETARAATA